MFNELYDAAKVLNLPQDIHIYTDINIYIDRLNALWGHCDKWLEFLWM